MLPLDTLERLYVESFRPKRLPFAASDRVIRLGDRGQADNIPAVAAVSFSFFQSSGEIILVPACLDQHDRAFRFEPSVEVVCIPVPGVVAACFAFSLRATFDRIVDHHKIGAKSGHARADTDGSNAAAIFCFPFVNGPAVL